MKTCVLLRISMCYLAHCVAIISKSVHCPVLHISPALLLHEKDADVLSVMCLVFLFSCHLSWRLLSTTVLTESGSHTWNSGCVHVLGRGASLGHYWAGGMNCYYSVLLVHRFAFSGSGAQEGGDDLCFSMRQKRHFCSWNLFFLINLFI